jgi:aspartyl-tRNA synthetase
MAERLGLVPNDRWDFLWVTEFPMFEWSDDEAKWVAKHHPFTAPSADDLEPATAKARAYDIVLNGVELGSGSVRIHRSELQSRVFEVLGIGAEDAQEKFGHMLQAFRYGVPPHAGFAFGLEHPRRDRVPEDLVGDRAADRRAQRAVDGAAEAARHALPGDGDAGTLTLSGGGGEPVGSRT